MRNITSSRMCSKLRRWTEVVDKIVTWMTRKSSLKRPVWVKWCAKDSLHDQCLKLCICKVCNQRRKKRIQESHLPSNKPLALPLLWSILQGHHVHQHKQLKKLKKRKLRLVFRAKDHYKNTMKIANSTKEYPLTQTICKVSSPSTIYRFCPQVSWTKKTSIFITKVKKCGKIQLIFAMI